MENNIVNVYGYIRVSTDGQVKQGYSLAEQRAEIENTVVPKVTNYWKFSKMRVSAEQKLTRTKCKYVIICTLPFKKTCRPSGRHILFLLFGSKSFR